MRPNKPPPLFRLPDELLYDICHLAALHEIEHSYKTRRSMSLVSRQLNRITTPLLYRYLGIYCGSSCMPSSPQGGRPSKLASKICIAKLHRQLKPKSNQSLRRHCKSLQLVVSNRYKEVKSADIAMVYDILSWLSGVSSLSLRVALPSRPAAPDFLETAVKHMPLLEELTYESSSEDVHAIFRALHLGSPRLQRMRLVSFGREEAQDDDTISTAQKIQTKSLHIDKHYGTFQDLHNLVRKLSGLEHFELSSSYRGPNNLDLQTLTSSLSTHRTTLRSIHLGRCSVDGILDLSEFVRLEVLSLNKSHIDDSNFTDAWGRRLLPQRLKLFRLDLSRDCGGSWASLSADIERWIKDFGDYARRRNSLLADIYINYSPDATVVSPGHFVNADGYPWDRMGCIKEHLRDLGIRLGYPRPNVTKDKWLLYKQIEMDHEIKSCAEGGLFG